MAEHLCKECIPVTEDPCLTYLWTSIPEIGLINGEEYTLSEVVQKFLFYVSTHSIPGTTTTSSSTTTTSTTVGDLIFITEFT